MWLSSRVKEQAESPQRDGASAAQHSAPGICLLWWGDAPVISLIHTSITGFRIQTHLDTGDYTDPRALEWGQTHAPAPDQLTTTGAGRGNMKNRYQRAMTCHGCLEWTRGSKDYDSNPFFIEKSFPNALLMKWHRECAVICVVVQNHLCFKQESKKPWNTAEQSIPIAQSCLPSWFPFPSNPLVDIVRGLSGDVSLTLQ